MLFQKGFELKRTAKMGIWDLLFKQIWFEGKINLFLHLERAARKSSDKQSWLG